MDLLHVFNLLQVFLINEIGFSEILNLQLLGGFPTKYKQLPIAMKKAKKLAKKLYTKLSEQKRKEYEDVRYYMSYFSQSINTIPKMK